MDSCHCKDECISIDGHDVPWTRKSLRLRRFVALLIKALLTCSNDCEHFLGGKVDLSDGVVLGVTQIQIVLVLSVHMAQALWVMELGLTIASIHEANLTISYLLYELHL